MREIVIVIADLYLDPEPASRPPAAHAVDTVAAAGIEHLARFGDRAALPQGWRPWVAHWLGLPQYAHEPTASVAAAALENPPVEGAVWMATPMHLIAGLSSVHFDRRSVLRLPRAELEDLAASFRATFHGSGFDLHPLEGGELLLSGPAVSAPSATTEPARMLLTSVAEALSAGAGAQALRRLSAEMEMWLHDHRVNTARARRGAPPVATLWLWGGGAPAAPRRAPAREVADTAFGLDAFIGGLWRLAGGETRPMPVDWPAVIGEPRAQRALGVVEVTELLHAHASWPLTQAVAEIDRRLISPSVAALHRGELDRLVLLANDRSLSLRAASRWRLWRRARAVGRGVEALA